jgi:myosin heavy subunit
MPSSSQSTARANLFSIAHTAATVTYCVDGFLQKNKDPLHEEMLLVMRESKSPLVRALFTIPLFTPPPAPPISGLPAATDVLTPAAVAGRPNASSSRFRGVISGFRSQLSSLVSLISKSDCSFVRCVKPNEIESPTAFDSALVQAQLSASGVLEAVRVSRTGYAVRLPYPSFTAEFEVLLGLAADPAAERRAWAGGGERQRAARLVAACGLSGERVAFGTSKVFLSSEVHYEMRTARTAMQVEGREGAKGCARSGGGRGQAVCTAHSPDNVCQGEEGGAHSWLCVC